MPESLRELAAHIEVRRPGDVLATEVAFGSLSDVAFWSMMVFLGVLTVGFAYEWKKGALEWA